MKKYTLVVFRLNGEILRRYFEGRPEMRQINAITGNAQIIDVLPVVGNFTADYATKQDATDKVLLFSMLALLAITAVLFTVLIIIS